MIEIRFLKAVEAILIPVKTLYLLICFTLQEFRKATRSLVTEGGFSI
jgi:hypothetical protein